jgi:hypothetical protein
VEVEWAGYQMATSLAQHCLDTSIIEQLFTAKRIYGIMVSLHGALDGIRCKARRAK